MTFTIHSIGDSAFLEQILIAVKMVTGGGDFKKMIAIGLLISAILACLRSLMANAERIDFQQILLGWITYQLLFVPTATITIENAYTGEVAVVEKAPFGVGAAGGIISSIGHGITKIFDTGFKTVAPGITTSNFAESLSLLNDVRRQVHNAAVFEAFDKIAGVDFDFQGSWHNYIRECTLTKLDLQATSLTKLMRQPIEEALSFNSNLYTTLLKTNAKSSNQGAILNCTEAYKQLRQLTDITNKNVEEAIGKTLGFSSFEQSDTFKHIGNALQALGASRTAAVDFVKASILEPLYYEAAAGRYKDWQDYNSAVMVQQAIQHRNTKWATEQTMFMTLVRPMLTFFEGFIYAITPLLAFMIVMGNFGIQLLGKYLQTIFWIQLWMPVMSIINMFIHVAATRAVAHLANSDAGLSSMYTLDAAGNILQHWVATGGMLAAATPMISLFVVSGSAYAMSGLAGRISSTEGIDTKITAPDAVQQSPILASGPTATHNSHSGMLAAGTESLVPSFKFGTAWNQGLSSVASQLRQSSQTFSNTLGSAISQADSQEQSYAMVADVGRSMASQNSEASSVIVEQAKNFSEQFGVSDQHRDYVQGLITAGVTGSMPANEVAKGLSKLVGKVISMFPGASAATKSDQFSAESPDIPTAADRPSPTVTSETPKDGSTLDFSGGPVAPSSTEKQTAGPRANASPGAKSQAGWGAKADARFANGNRNPSAKKESKSKFNVEASARTSSGAEDSANWKSDAVSNFVKGLKGGTEHSQRLTTGLAQKFSDQSRQGYKTTWGKTQSENLARSANEVNSLSSTYSKMSNLQSQIGTATQADLRSLAAAVVKDDHAARYLNDHFNATANQEVRREAVDISNRYRDVLQMDPIIADTAGKMAALSNSVNQSPEETLQSLQGVARAIQMSMGYDPGLSASPSSLQPIEGDSALSSLEQRVNQGVGKGPGAGDIGNIRTHAKTQLPADGAAIQADAGNNQAAIQQQQAQANRALSAPHIRKAQLALLNSPYGMPYSTANWGKVDNAVNWGFRHADQIGDALHAGSTESVRAFNHHLEQLHTMTPQQREQFLEKLNEEGGATSIGGKIGYGLVGAITSGYSAAKEWIAGKGNLSEAAKGMTLAQRGAYYGAAFSTAAREGYGTAMRFMQEHGREFKNTLAEVAQSRHGLTTAQAAVYAESFDTNQERMAEAIKNLKVEYAATHSPSGTASFNENGQPMLSEQDTKVTDRLVSIIQGSTRAGELAGSHLATIRQYNLATRKLND